MKVSIREKNGRFPELSYGDVGRELSCLIPEKYEWTQINYGQGEGQFHLKGSEWGVYYDDDDNLVLELHSDSGDLELLTVVNFIEDIKEKIENDYGVRLKLYITSN